LHQPRKIHAAGTVGNRLRTLYLVDMHQCDAVSQQVVSLAPGNADPLEMADFEQRLHPVVRDTLDDFTEVGQCTNGSSRVVLQDRCYTNLFGIQGIEEGMGSADIVPAAICLEENHIRPERFRESCGLNRPRQGRLYVVVDGWQVERRKRDTVPRGEVTI